MNFLHATSMPLTSPLCVILFEENAQFPIGSILWFCQFRILVLAEEMRLQPATGLRQHRVTFGADTLEVWRTHGVHAAIAHCLRCGILCVERLWHSVVQIILIHEGHAR